MSYKTLARFHLTSPRVVRRQFFSHRILLRTLVCSVFLLAGIAKLPNLRAFLSSVENLPWLPEVAAPVAGSFVLSLEIAVGLFMLSNRWVRWGAWLGAALSSGFTVVNVALIARGTPAECGCFGLLLHLPPFVMIAVDVCLLAACGCLLWPKEDSASADAVPTAPGSNASLQSSIRGVSAELTGNRTRHLRRWILVLAVFLTAEIVVIGWVAETGGAAALAKWLPQANTNQAVMSLDEWKAMVMRDPKIGSRVRAVQVMDEMGVQTYVNSRNRPVGLLFIGKCSSCALRYVSEWDRIQRAHPEADMLVIPAHADSEDVRAFREENALIVRFVIAGNAALEETYNPYFRPRVYLSDKLDRLSYVQHPSTSIDLALAEAKRILDGPTIVGGSAR